MRDVAIVSFASFATPRSDLDEVEMLVPVITEAIGESGIPKKEIGFTVSGSCDYLGGRPFSFVMALDAVGAWPPISESHVEMDGAWALYEAWVRLQHGDIDSALVYAFGRSSQGDLGEVMVTQLDPYVVAPLAPDWMSLAALQARALIDAERCTERDMADVAARSRRRGKARGAEGPATTPRRTRSRRSGGTTVPRKSTAPRPSSSSRGIARRRCAPAPRGFAGSTTG